MEVLGMERRMRVGSTIQDSGKHLLNDLWRNDLARSAPGGEAVNDHYARLGDSFLVLIHAVSDIHVS